MLTDEAIIARLFDRDETALEELQAQYQSFASGIARNILGNPQDAEECVSGAFLRVWNEIPPARPKSLKAFLSRIVRNLALDTLRHNRADRRGGGQAHACLDELADCVPDTRSGPEPELDRKALSDRIDAFLAGLSKRDRVMFVGRYYYARSLADVAARAGLTESQAKGILFRLRQKLLKQLNENCTEGEKII